MRQLLKAASWVALLLFLLPRLAAAQTDTPIIFLRANEQIFAERNPYSQPGILGYGDLYKWTPGDAEPFRMTNWDYNRAPALSPDGRMVAYQSVPEAIVNQLGADGYFFDYDVDAPSNIWLMNVATLDAVRIAEPQPGSSAIGAGDLRSKPVWSPDSRQIAWLEFEPVTDRLAGQLVVYNVETQATSIWATGLGMGFFDGGIVHIANPDGWGSHIAHTVWTYGIPENFAPGVYPGDAGYVTAMINEQGVRRSEAVSITLSEVMDYQADIWFWAQRGGAWVFAIHYPSGWQILDSVTGERLALANAPLRQTASGAGLRLRYENGGWSIIEPDGTPTLLPESASSPVLAPDGRSVAYLDGTTAYLWSPGQAASPLLPESAREWQILSLDWSPMVWQAEGEAQPIPTMIPGPTRTPNQG
jgi:hypothetical protein